MSYRGGKTMTQPEKVWTPTTRVLRAHIIRFNPCLNSGYQLTSTVLNSTCSPADMSGSDAARCTETAKDEQ